MKRFFDNGHLVTNYLASCLKKQRSTMTFKIYWAHLKAYFEILKNFEEVEKPKPKPKKPPFVSNLFTLHLFTLKTKARTRVKKSSKSNFCFKKVFGVEGGRPNVKENKKTL